MVLHSGIVNIIHGRFIESNTEPRFPIVFKTGGGDGKAIAAAGREEVERGLNKIEGKHARATDTDTPNGGRPHDDTGAGAAPVRDPNAPQASAAAPRADPSAAPATNGHPGPADKETGTGTGGAVGPGGPGSFW